MSPGVFRRSPSARARRREPPDERAVLRPPASANADPLPPANRLGAQARSWDRGGMNETRLFRIVLSVIALRVIDDTVLQPAAGTSVADHPVSALIPLAVLAF